ncbi:MAG: hypothetical protein U9R74_03040 [Pseudomonadota bacterium]|nr:hypothetical protein [Pseudomonadota bacterium]
MIVTATQIRIRGITGLVRFFPRVRSIRNQLASADGLLFMRFSGLRTLTGWESREAMKAFRNSGPHLEAMKKLRTIGKAKSITWETRTEPGWDVARKKLQEVKF